MGRATALFLHHLWWAGRLTWYQHHTVNHSRWYVDPQTGTHTQHLERAWRSYKEQIWRLRGNRTDSLLSDNLSVIKWNEWKETLWGCIWSTDSWHFQKIQVVICSHCNHFLWEMAPTNSKESVHFVLVVKFLFLYYFIMCWVYLFYLSQIIFRLFFVIGFRITLNCDTEIFSDFIFWYIKIFFQRNILFFVLKLLWSTFGVGKALFSHVYHCSSSYINRTVVELQYVGKLQ